MSKYLYTTNSLIHQMIDYFIRFSENLNGYFEKFNFNNYI